MQKKISAIKAGRIGRNQQKQIAGGAQLIYTLPYCFESGACFPRNMRAQCDAHCSQFGGTCAFVPADFCLFD